MAYQVVLADRAKSDAQGIYHWVIDAAPERGRIWFEELIKSLASLSRFPLRCPIAREAEKIGRPIRCLLFGEKRNIYRILYEVDEARTTVRVLHIRHGARKDARREELAQ